MRKQPTTELTNEWASKITGDLTGYQLSKLMGVRAQHIYNVFPKVKRNDVGLINKEDAVRFASNYFANKS
jgi:hypothetical protein